MIKKLILSIVAICIGVIVGYFVFYRTQVHNLLHVPGTKVIGFLPYWLADRAKKDYGGMLTNLSYFSLTVDSDGKIKKLNNPAEEEPGWYSLHSGKMDPFFDAAKNNGETLSLTIFSGNNETIGQLINNPIPHADNLVNEITPIMKKYGFSDLNLDIEYTDTASDSARMNFSRFVSEVKSDLNKNKTSTLSIDVSPTAFIKNYLVDPAAVSKNVDSVIIMGYDYHFQNSAVTGPVAPLFGTESDAEFDIQTAVQKALSIMPAQKIILGAPLYGYAWETTGDTPRSPIIPGTGLTASSKYVKGFLNSCATCSAKLDTKAQEKYVIYKDQDTNSYHQFFYPDQDSMAAKVAFAQKYNLGGIALWALGYEDDTILNPLKNY